MKLVYPNGLLHEIFMRLEWTHKITTFHWYTRQDYELYKFTWEESGMNNGHSLLKAFKTIGLILTLGVSMSACATGTFKWKEEVQLHDGKK